ncbi:MAG TPA: UDP-N-acetylmuramate dehydrogenase [Bacteroidales bacterium]|nr:UDP-N-acetylmuramate dehydrogenase [Bacteroidales bacterium]
MLQVERAISLKPYNTFAIDIVADYFVRIKSENELIEILNNPQYKALPRLILGTGSNVLLTAAFHGLVLKMEISGIEVIAENEQHVIVRVGAGQDWDNFVEYCVKQNWCGIENLSLIPGTVGACPVQNIGAYGVEVKDCIEKVEGIDCTTLKIFSLSNEDCQFGYRSSIFKKSMAGQYVITHVIFKLNKQLTPILSYGNIKDGIEKTGVVSLENIRKVIIDIRNSKLPDPKDVPNAGSFFKNPVIANIKAEKLKKKWPNIVLYPIDCETTKVSAAWLIDNAGLKGFTYKDAKIHDRQPLVLTNIGNASGQDILDLATIVLQKVKEKFDIELEMEVNKV